MKILFSSFRMLMILTVLTGVVYPVIVWGVGHAFFRAQAEGSLLYDHERIIGSALLAQKTDGARWFVSRPSAADYATVASGASNYSRTNAKLMERLKNPGDQPADMITTSGSGLDPHLSPESVRLQFERVAQARRWNSRQRAKVADWIAIHIEGGKIGPEYVNILQLNFALTQIETLQ